MDERAKLQQAIDALQAQRAQLGDAVVDAALGPLREKLAWLEAPVPGAPPEQLLRQVSVLFLDVVGSTALSQHLDPEEVHAVMDGMLQRGTAIVRSHGGRVLQYAGDNLLAAFGAERVREDDAERAVACGLALLAEGRGLRERVRREHGVDGCDVRVGVHTGPVLLGGGVDEDGTIRGLTVNIAARMEQTAPGGALRISAETWQLVRGAFDAVAQPPLQVKGRREPMLTYLVQGLRSRERRARARGIEGLLPPMVGRDAELATLRALLDEAAAQRLPRAATLVGEAGLGKTRLLHELLRELEGCGRPLWLLQGRAQPMSQLQPYGLLRDLLAWRLQIADSDSSEQARTRLVEGLVPWLGENAPAQAHRIGQLIGLDFSASPHVMGLEPRLLRRLAFEALRRYLQGLGEGGTLPVLVLEDLQWADEGSLDFVDSLTDTGPAVPAPLPLLLVCSARRELLERRPAWGSGRPGHRLLPLAPLDAAQGDALAGALLCRAAGEGAAALQALLVARAEGNPFFMEELVHMFIDEGVIAVDGGHWRVLPERLHLARVPGTLVGVLQARLDSLPAADRLALQQASIVGHVFWDDALSALDARAPGALPGLRGRALIELREGSAFEGTPEEAFHHHLLQQVTYDTVLKPMRRAGHAAAAQWLAERVGDRPAEYLAITGEHYERAGDHARALDYFVRASREAASRFATQAAVAHIERALASPAAADLRLRYELLGRLQNLCDLAGQYERFDTTGAQREAIAEQLDDDAMRADVAASRALLASRRGDEALAFELATRAAELGRRSGNHHAVALATGQTAWSLRMQGRLEAAAAQVALALDGLREEMRRRPEPGYEKLLLEVQLLAVRASIEEAGGDLRGAEGTLTEALALARERGFRRPQVSLQESMALVHKFAGRHELAIEGLQRCLTSAREIGWAIYLPVCHFNLARCHLELGRADEARVLLAEAESGALDCANTSLHGRCLMLRGRLEAQAGAHAAAHALYDEARRRFEQTHGDEFLCQLRACSALLWLAEGRPAQARQEAEAIEAALAGGLALAGTDEPLLPRLACHRVWAALDEPVRAVEALRPAHEALHAMAARSGDEASRRSILGNIATHREIQAAWAACASPRAR